MQKRDLNRSSRKKNRIRNSNSPLRCVFLVFPLCFLLHYHSISIEIPFFFFFLFLSHPPCSLFLGSPWHIYFIFYFFVIN